MAKVNISHRINLNYLHLLFVLQVLLLMPQSLRAEYLDHRNRKVDSLEQVLKTQKLEGRELYSVYDGLMNGYLQTDAAKSSHYAKLAIELAEKNKLYNALCDSWRVLGLQAYGACLYDSAQHCFDRALLATDQMKNDKQYEDRDIDTHDELYDFETMEHVANRVNRKIIYLTK